MIAETETPPSLSHDGGVDRLDSDLTSNKPVNGPSNSGPFRVVVPRDSLRESEDYEQRAGRMTCESRAAFAAIGEPLPPAYFSHHQAPQEIKGHMPTVLASEDSALPPSFGYQTDAATGSARLVPVAMPPSYEPETGTDILFELAVQLKAILGNTTVLLSGIELSAPERDERVRNIQRYADEARLLAQRLGRAEQTGSAKVVDFFCRLFEVCLRDDPARRAAVRIAVGLDTRLVREIAREANIPETSLRRRVRELETFKGQLSLETTVS